MSYLLLCLTWCFKKAFQEIGLPLLCIKLVWSDPVKMTKDCRFKRWLMTDEASSNTRNTKKVVLEPSHENLFVGWSVNLSEEMRMSVSFAYMTERGKSDIRTLLTTLVSAYSWSHLKASSGAAVSLFDLMSVGSSNTHLTVMVFACGAFWIKSVPTRRWTRCLLKD